MLLFSLLAALSFLLLGFPWNTVPNPDLALTLAEGPLCGQMALQLPGCRLLIYGWHTGEPHKDKDPNCLHYFFFSAGQEIPVPDFLHVSRITGIHTREGPIPTFVCLDL